DAIDGELFYAMPFIEGGSLQQLLQKQENRPLQGREAALLLRQVADAVQCVHDRGVVHRDIKPQNILLSAESESPGGKAAPKARAVSVAGRTPRLTDFGLARTREGGGTAEGEKLGTPSYMAPEQ